jgi:hypothetical protein
MKGLQPGSDFPGDALEIPEAQPAPRKGVAGSAREKEEFRLDVSSGRYLEEKSNLSQG